MLFPGVGGQTSLKMLFLSVKLIKKCYFQAYNKKIISKSMRLDVKKHRSYNLFYTLKNTEAIICFIYVKNTEAIICFIFFSTNFPIIPMAFPSSYMT